MIGNAVPVKFAEVLAGQILKDVSGFRKSRRNELVKGTIISGDRKKRRRYAYSDKKLAS